ncbi:hypothetical protein RHA1_ro08821 (plasmid) [Rhodococcus jostii RHA1]|uniref:Uncharacterized protein n=1 Tax=Rhodococcus jostii (strain RHA1) TaxID=101510 RepID=Q0RXX1_RHOJR|nr:hypothetical protein RHA1_ro08821 [Rhodococcus jostii RHA1]
MGGVIEGRTGGVSVRGPSPLSCASVTVEFGSTRVRKPNTDDDPDQGCNREDDMLDSDFTAEVPNLGTHGRTDAARSSRPMRFLISVRLPEVDPGRAHPQGTRTLPVSRPCSPPPTWSHGQS